MPRICNTKPLFVRLIWATHCLIPLPLPDLTARPETCEGIRPKSLLLTQSRLFEIVPSEEVYAPCRTTVACVISFFILRGRAISNYDKMYVSLFGVLTTVATTLFFVVIVQQFDYALYTLMLVYVIPTGAILAGAMAASGYYLGSVLTDSKPAGGIALNMGLAGLSAYLMIDYLPFYLLEIDGQSASKTYSFWFSLDYGIRHTPIWPNSAFRIDEPGMIIGYGFALLQLAGFVAGGLAVYGLLSSKSYCDACACYRKRVFNEHRYLEDVRDFSRNVQELSALASRNLFQKAIAYHQEHMGDRDKGDRHRLMSVLEVSQCQSCGNALLSFEPESLGDHPSEEVERARFSAAAFLGLNFLSSPET